MPVVPLASRNGLIGRTLHVPPVLRPAHGRCSCSGGSARQTPTGLITGLSLLAVAACSGSISAVRLQLRALCARRVQARVDEVLGKLWDLSRITLGRGEHEKCNRSGYLPLVPIDWTFERGSCGGVNRK